MKIFILSFFLMLSFVSFASDKPVMILDANEIKQSTSELFLDDVISVDLNGNKIKDSISYTYSDMPPKIVFDVIVDGQKKKVSLICNSISIYKVMHNKMRDLSCGMNKHLYWNGKTYVDKFN